jgi:hypothetical protein
MPMRLAKGNRNFKLREILSIAKYIADVPGKFFGTHNHPCKSTGQGFSNNKLLHLFILEDERAWEHIWATGRTTNLCTSLEKGLDVYLMREPVNL